jgi:hypothetical protein
MSELKLGCYGIIINWNGEDKGSAAISSDLHEKDSSENSLYNAAIDGIESLILAHFCAGIEVDSPAYVEGIQTATDACGNNIEDGPDDDSISLKELPQNIQLDQEGSESMTADVSSAREDVANIYTTEEMNEFESFDEFWAAIDATNAFEEDWDEYKVPMKPLYLEVFCEYRPEFSNK